MTRLHALVIAAGVLMGLAACSHPQARTLPVRPPLEVPEPPARTITPPPPEEPPPAAAQPPDAAVQKPVRPRPAQPKPEPPPQPPPTQVGPPQATPAAPSPLQTTPPAGQGEMIAAIKDTLSRARRDLKGINPATLNADGKAQYDTATKFADQADEALKDMNLVFAKTLADKAATLARSLGGRF